MACKSLIRIEYDMIESFENMDQKIKEIIVFEKISVRIIFEAVK